MQHGLPYVAVLILLSSVPLCAQDLTQGGPPAPAAAADASANHDVGSDSDDSGWVRAWMRIADKARASQPHFVAPLVTTHVMLVQQSRILLCYQARKTPDFAPTQQFAMDGFRTARSVVQTSN
jgi:hypothetical protein